MLTFMLGTVILALIYGGFWHNRPARGRDRLRVEKEQWEEI